MLKLLSVLASILFLAACAESEDTSAQNHGESLELFNALYSLPESLLPTSCVVDAKIAVISVDRFLETLDRIAEETDAGILYSDMTQRGRVVYVAPTQCGGLDTHDAFAAKKYFDNVLSVTKTKAADYPFISRSLELRRANLTVDLSDAAFAAKLTPFEPPDNDGDQVPWEDLFCFGDAAVRAQKQYGLPLVEIRSTHDTLLYIYNMRPADSALADYLVNLGFNECGTKHDYEIRKLNEDEMTEVLAAYVKQ